VIDESGIWFIIGRRLRLNPRLWIWLGRCSNFMQSSLFLIRWSYPHSNSQYSLQQVNIHSFIANFCLIASLTVLVVFRSWSDSSEDYYCICLLTSKRDCSNNPPGANIRVKTGFVCHVRKFSVAVLWTGICSTIFVKLIIVWPSVSGTTTYYYYYSSSCFLLLIIYTLSQFTP
jgi:hypothetical protein